ncbi:MAG: hypothetical protein K0R34_814 [Herbinix sp.]|jgi:hypothetical protein|nr:hypothetical protein [Herbinix sp.]
MKTLIPQFLAMAVSGTIFITISMKLGWSRKLWDFINRRLNPIYNATVWILFAAVLHLSIQMVCGSLGIADARLIIGILIGFYFAFIPNLGAKKDNK